ncbi:asparagine synthase (glutamine-hydrolyzing) [Parasporobacterium paucivorans]|uniref:asparagine synthase (glutamine-hydrolyzing) n=1 Tax=Parasporobacterium paucivorans DSM 15970 TaxID=1122934 RepID=A0A1M6F5T9_9FIRM|nr:asparagine synthase (glutamine-hydrolyzing) [Parasporobacterium paucivorans]SHI93094.1 asparagine synthase (glutamine-hydrolysing) [Parasporobacterium paucivorans DSM 15970]
MCGFTGYVTVGPRAEMFSENLTAMMDSIRHRGPDDEGRYMDDVCGLGFRRLSIIGITNGKQPMCNEDGTITVVFNGEIYNYMDIKSDLVEKGHIFKTDADTEVLVHGYEEYGIKILSRLRGMYAFAIRDVKQNQLFIARDIFGIKPLYYSNTGNEFVFGSEIKAILKFPTIKKELNQEALESYLSFQYSVLEETFYKNIFRLPPAHYLLLKNGDVKIHRYWEAVFNEDDSRTFEECIEGVNEVMKDSIEAHKISDTEVGGFLSGGVDSGYIVARSNLDKTFSVGFDYQDYSEIDKAKKLSEYVGVKNYEHLISTEEYFEELPRIMAHADEPIADPSAIALYFVCRLAAKQVKVVLSGEGSDELFGGYNIYRTPMALGPMGAVPKGVRRAVAKMLEAVPVSFKGKQYLIRAGKDISERFIGNAFMFSTKEVNRLVRNPLKKRTPFDITRPLYEKVKNKDDVTKMQYIDINTWLWGDILNKADTMSMAHSLEVRVPFLDREVAKFAFSVPVRYRITKTETKAYFRKAARKFMPEITADRKKLGFPVPVKHWLREKQYYDMIRATLLSGTSAGIFNISELDKLLRDHYEGKCDNARRIWTVYAFLLWYEKHFQSEA